MYSRQSKRHGWHQQVLDQQVDISHASSDVEVECKKCNRLKTSKCSPSAHVECGRVDWDSWVYVFRPVHGQGCLSLDHNEVRLGGVARSDVEVE